MKKLILNTLKYGLRSYPVIKPYLKRIDTLYTMTQQEIEDYNNRQFLELINLAYSRSKFYHNFYDAHGIDIKAIKSIDDISMLPITDKSIIRENANDIAIGCKATLFKAATSGSTGEPLTIRQNYKAILTKQAYLHKYRSHCGFHYGEPLVSLRGHLDSNTFKLKVKNGNILYLSSYQINPLKANDYYNEIIEHAPKAIEGYPSSIYNLCCILRDNGLKLNIPLCFTSSETLYDFQRKLFHEILNCETYDWYGCTELSICLSESKNHDGYFEAPGYSFNEYNENSIITTSFINPRFPLIRYQVNDRISLKPDYLRINAIDPNIKTIEGRTENSIITKSGTIIGRLNFLFKEINYIKLAQIVQREKGTIEINIVPDGPFGEAEKSKITKHIEDRIGLSDIDFRINIVSDSEIIYTKRNKFNQVVKL